MSKKKEFYTIEEYTAITNYSKSSIYRFYDERKELRKDWGMIKRKRGFPHKHIKHFNKNYLLEENTMLTNKNDEITRKYDEVTRENKSMKNLIDCLIKNEEEFMWLYNMEWSLIGTISYAKEYSASACYNQMYKLNKSIIKTFGNDVGVRMFFNNEKYDDRGSCYHSHFAIYCEDKTLIPAIQNHIEKQYPNDRTDIQHYTKYKGWLFYITKNGLKGINWDIDFNEKGKPKIDYEKHK